MTRVAYLSHPIGSSQGGDELVHHHDNLAHADAWKQFLIENTKWALLCPVYVANIRVLHQPRALMGQITLLLRADIVVQVGGWISPHMEIERNHADRNQIPILNLTPYGYHPPTDDRQVRAIMDALHKQMAKLEQAMPRRVWLPPLEPADIDALRAAQIVLKNDPFSLDAAACVERIVQAALRKG